MLIHKIQNMKFINSYILVLLSMVSLSFFSCQSDKLTREKAALLVKGFYEYPNLLVKSLKVNPNENPLAFGINYDDLINGGYMFLDKSNPWSWKHSLTPKGEEFLVASSNEVECATREFKEITGIKFTNENQTTAEIEFSCRVFNITPFGQFFKISNDQIDTYKVTAEKYDDGWRITTQKGKVYKAPQESPNMFIGKDCSENENLQKTIRQDGMAFNIYHNSEHILVVQRKFKGKCNEIVFVDGAYGFNTKDFNGDGYEDLIQTSHKDIIIAFLYSSETKTFEESGRFGADPYKALSDSYKYTMIPNNIPNIGHYEFFRFDKLHKVTTADMRFTYDSDYSKLEKIEIFKINGESEKLIDSISNATLLDLNRKGQIVLDGSAENYRGSIEAFVEKYWSENSSKLK
jgi:hypothetical protein